MLAGWIALAPRIARAEDAAAAPPAVSVARAVAGTLPLERVRPRMKGYGLTVFEGFKIEPFEVEVIDVLRGFLPKQDIILMRGRHPVLARAGVLGGMSGSPIYLEGKLVGALAYGWRFAKEPIFGVTPIANMLRLRDYPWRPEPAPANARAEPPARAAAAWWAELERRRWWELPFAAGRRASKAAAGPEALLPVTVPLNTAGLTADARAQLRRGLASFGFEPLQGGGTGKSEGPERLTPGAALGVTLVDGDVAMNGTGTATWVEGSAVLAFGHSMFNAGQLVLPVGSARINHSLANLAHAFKLSSPARELGALVQDRQEGVLADTSRRARMIPMTVTLRAGEQREVYRVRVADHRMLTPMLVGSVVTSAIGQARADVADVSYDLITRLTVRGYPELRIVEQQHSDVGLRAAAANARGLAALRALMSNPFATVAIERIDVDLSAHYDRQPLRIVALAVPANVVAPGARVPLRVTFKPFAGPEVTRSYPLTIPRLLAGSVIVVEVGSGSSIRPEFAPPETLAQLLAQLPKSYPSRAVVVSLRSPSQGLKLRGRLVDELPPSALDTLRTGAEERDSAPLKTAERSVFPAPEIVLGRKELRLRVMSTEESE
ncbi:MAG: hypothetical protein IPL40_06215 [Proteobacteria bacterium]|nr:hypothetical protein [Pseudomonadota bacterium]